MKNYFLAFFLLCFGSVFSQSLEDDIYTATEVFNASKSAEALETLNRKIENYKIQVNTTDDYFAFINLLINKAHFLKSINRNNQAISTYEYALNLYNSKNIASEYQYNIVEYCLIPLGVLYNKVGDYTSAENTIKSYGALAQKNNNRSQQITAAINLSRLYQTIGKHKSAIEIATYGLSLNGANKQQKTKLKLIKVKSETLLNKNYTPIDDKVITHNSALNTIESQEIAYQTAMEKGDYKAALKAFNILKILKKDAMSSASFISKIYIEEAQLYYLLNKPDMAIKNAKIALKTLLPTYDSKSIPETTNLYPDNAFIGVFDLLATLETNAQKALNYYDLSFYVSDLLAKNTTNQEGKLILLNEKRRRSDKYLALLYQQYENEKIDNVFSALQIAERYKAFVLSENTEKKDLLKLNPKDSLLIKEQQLLKEQYLLTNKLLQTPYNNYNTTEKIKLSNKLTTLNNRIKVLNNAIEEKYKLKNDAINVSALKAKLNNDQAVLVEYFYGKNDMYQIIISDTMTAFNRIPLNESNTALITDFIKFFDTPSAINNNISAFTEKAFSVYNMLNLDAISSKKNTLIIADGLLHFIPFDALITEQTESKTFAKMPFFVKQHNSVFNASVSLYLKETKKLKEPNVLGVFPVFKNTNLELNYSLDEAKSIKNEIETTLLMEAQATKPSFLKDAKNYSILHLSTHGKSGDFFNPAQIAFTDAPLTTNELYAVDLNPNLVVLSACETGVGMLKRGEGAMSIARGFQYAGAENVLFSLWQISDLSTSQIMTSFYENLSETKSISFSNHQSKIDYLNNGSIKNLKKSPYYWSAFTLHGGFNTVESNPFNFISIIAISIVIVLLLLWLYKRFYGKRTLGISSKERL